MGNAMGGGVGRTRRERIKVMKIDGETLKLNSPTKALDVIKHHPNHILLESESVKHHGLKAKPLEPHHDLKPKNLYFLIQLPELPADDAPRRFRSGLEATAVDRLECLMMSRSRRSVSEIQVDGPGSGSGEGSVSGSSGRVKIRMPRAQVEKLVEESKDTAEAAKKIVNLYVTDGVSGDGGSSRGGKAREKRVSFVHMKEEVFMQT